MSRFSLFLLCSLVAWCVADDAAAALQAALSAATQGAAGAAPPQQSVAVGASSAAAASGYGSASVERASGQLWVWGLFDDSAQSAASRVAFGGLGDRARVVQISAGGYHVLALLDDGTLWSFGRAVHGAERGSSASPLHAVRAGGALLGRNVVLFAAGNDHNVAVDHLGRVLTWGANARGQLGSGDATPHAAPHAVLTLDAVVAAHGGVRQVCAGSHHSALLTHDGSLFTWGGSTYGQTALGTTDDVKLPTRVAPPSPDAKFVAVSCGGDHTIAQTDDGRLFGAGWNEHGQLCNNSTLDSSVFVPIAAGLTDVVAFDAGQYASTAFVLADGRLLSCGLGEDGALGHGFASVSVPTPVALAGAAASVDVGFQHTIVRLQDGRVVTFGSNAYSQLGQKASEASDASEADDARYGRVVFDGDAWLGVASDANGREMLDRAVVRANATALTNGHQGALFVGVYDGHGGDAVVKALEQTLHIAVLREMARETKHDAVLLDVEQAEVAFARSFRAVNKAIRGQPAAQKQGAVALAAVLQTHEDFCELPFYRLHVAFVGDCSVLVSERTGSFELLGAKHRAVDAEEAARVRASGGVIANNRVGGVLAVTRAFGDAMFDETVVPATPETAVLDITTAHDVLVFGTDGFFDFVPPADALLVARDESLAPPQIAAKLTQMAVERGSRDNIMVVVVRPAPLQPFLCGADPKTAPAVATDVPASTTHDEL